MPLAQLVGAFRKGVQIYDDKQDRKKDNERKDEQHAQEMELLKAKIEKEKLQVEKERTIKQNLYHYVDNKDVVGARRAIQAGADVEIGVENCTPLFAAVVYEHLGLVELLLSKGANTNRASGVIANTDKPLNRPPLVDAAHRGNLSICRSLINHGANIHATDGEGTTALIVAANNGHTEVCRLLLSHNANVHATNAIGRDALYEAATGGHRSVCELLIQYGGNPRRKVTGTVCTNTAIDQARSNGFTALADYLQKH